MNINKTKYKNKYWLPTSILVCTNLTLLFVQFILTHKSSKRGKVTAGQAMLVENKSDAVNTMQNQTPHKSKQLGEMDDTPKGRYGHKPHYNVRTAAQSYSNIAAILAGFAFTAVILVLPNSHISQKLSEQATIAFLIAFFGCILSAFMFSIVTGEEILAPRTNMIAFFGGIGFSISASLILWGVVTLMKVFFHDEQIIGRAHLVYGIFTLLQPAFLSSTVLDNTVQFQGRSPNWKEIFVAIIPGYLPFIVPLLSSLSFLSLSFDTISLTAITVSGGIIFISSLMALLMSYVRHKYELPILLSALAIFLHSCVLALLILTA